jgi:hypothetical protein
VFDAACGLAETATPLSVLNFVLDKTARFIVETNAVN